MKSLIASALMLSVITHGFSQGTLLTGGYIDYSGGPTPVTFTLTFNHPPDLLTADTIGRQADSFQFFISTTVVRGEEIHIAGDVRVRDQSPSSGDPDSGGWGALRGSVP